MRQAPDQQSNNRQGPSSKLVASPSIDLPKGGGALRGGSMINYTHNEHGSMVSMPHLQNMEWNFAEKLKHVAKGTMEAYYNYDWSGGRTRKVVEKGNIIEERLYLGGFEIFRKRNGNILELERETLHIMDDKKRIALVETKTYENGQIANPAIVQRYQLSNNIESAALELDGNANIISYEEYYPYGDTSYQAGSSGAEVSRKRYRYTGKEKDEESGLYYMLARYYSGWLSRWTAADPAGLVDGVNLYAYCRGNPVAFLDEDGRQTLNNQELFGMTSADSFGMTPVNQAMPPANLFGMTLIEQANDSENKKGVSILIESTAKQKEREDLARRNAEENRCPMATREPGAKFFMQKSFNTIEEAGIAAVNKAHELSMKENREVGGMIYQDKISGEFHITSLYKGCEDEIRLPDVDLEHLHYKLVGMYHTHGPSTKNIDLSFSPDDMGRMREYEIVGFLKTNAENAKGYKHLEGVQIYNHASLSQKEIDAIKPNNYDKSIRNLIRKGVITIVK
ncbi:MAG: DUF4329 domain-containing protein [Fibromonadaceae bacterium]|jgi:RHS repeat-associated protein|nr:DUF4329 domain-containing protein [Fibromonadaceae bacterium]